MRIARRWVQLMPCGGSRRSARERGENRRMSGAGRGAAHAQHLAIAQGCEMDRRICNLFLRRPAELPDVIQAPHVYTPLGSNGNCELLAARDRRHLLALERPLHLHALGAVTHTHTETYALTRTRCRRPPPKPSADKSTDSACMSRVVAGTCSSGRQAGTHMLTCAHLRGLGAIKTGAHTQLPAGA